MCKHDTFESRFIENGKVEDTSLKDDYSTSTETESAQHGMAVDISTVVLTG